MKKASDTLTIINTVFDLDEKEREEWRDKVEINGVVKNALQFSSSVMKNNAQTFLNEVSAMLKNLDTTVSKFELEEVEISAAVTVSGKLVLVSLGGELSGEGGIKFVFTRRK